MSKLPTILLLLAAALPIGAKFKVKEKRYQPVPVTDVRQIADRYVGIDPDFVVQLRVSDAGEITGTLRNFGESAALSSIRLDGAELTASIDGRPLHATFVNRIPNGDAAFGLVVHDVDAQIDDVTLTQIFCRRQ